MTKLKCPTCGSNNFREEENKYICQYCGTTQIKPHPFPKKRITLMISLLLLIFMGIIVAYRLLYTVKEDIVEIKQNTSYPKTNIKEDTVEIKHNTPHPKVTEIVIKTGTSPIHIEKETNPFSNVIQKVESRYGHATPSNLEKSIEYYFNQEKNKAFYIAIDENGDYVTAISYAAPTAQDAENKALEQCEKKRKENGIKSRCIPYALNDHISRYMLDTQISK